VRPLLLSEVFGPTLQGEGPSQGRRAAFVRLGLCNLDCTWCDTPYTWDWSGKNGPRQDRGALYHSEAADLAEQLRLLRVPLVVITGGEPMLQQTALGPLVRLLAESRVDVEIETNGTLPATDFDVSAHARFNVSPKLSGSGVEPQRALNPEVLSDYERRHAAFKFVVSELAELDEVQQLVDDLDIDPARVWIMPEGRHGPIVLAGMRLLAEPVIERGWNLTTRLHVLLWGDERGR
jgi:7-carboxy-7-deazaguanine synthase